MKDKKIRLCYKVKINKGEGEDTIIYEYVDLTVDTYNVPKKKYQLLVDLGVGGVAQYYNVNEEDVTPITLNEYLDNNGGKCV